MPIAHRNRANISKSGKCFSLQAIKDINSLDGTKDENFSPALFLSYARIKRKHIEYTFFWFFIYLKLAAKPPAPWRAFIFSSCGNSCHVSYLFKTTHKPYAHQLCIFRSRHHFIFMFEKINTKTKFI